MLISFYWVLAYRLSYAPVEEQMPYEVLVNLRTLHLIRTRFATSCMKRCMRSSESGGDKKTLLTVNPVSGWYLSSTVAPYSFVTVYSMPLTTAFSGSIRLLSLFRRIS